MCWILTLLVLVKLSSSQYTIECRLNVITVTSGRTSGSGSEAISPAFKVALEDMVSTFPVLYDKHQHISLDLIGAPKALPPDLQYDLLKTLPERIFSVLENSSSTDVTLVVTAVGTYGYQYIGDFARELNFLSVACGPVELPHSQFPTSLYMFNAGSVNLFGEALVNLMDHFKWRTLSIINDRVSRVPLGARAVAMCRGSLTMLQQAAARINHMTINVDSSVRDDDLDDALMKASNHSRIILCCTLNKPMQALLKKAALYNMTAGNYVFLYLYEGQLPYERPMEWIYQENTVFEDALGKVLMLRSAPVDWNLAYPLTSRVVQHRSRAFGTTPDEELMHNDYIINCYESVQMASTLLNEIGIPGPKSALGKGNVADIVSSFIQKTTQLPLRQISFLPSGDRTPEIVLQRLQTIDFLFKDVMRYNCYNQSWNMSGNRSNLWKDGVVPPDRPRCGIRNDLCGDNLNSQFYISSISISIAVILLLFGSVFWYSRRVMLLVGIRILYDTHWWSLTAALLERQAALLLVASAMLLTCVCFTDGQPESQYFALEVAAGCFLQQKVFR